MLIWPRRRVHSSLPLLSRTSVPLLALSFAQSSPPGSPLSRPPFSTPLPRLSSSELSLSLGPPGFISVILSSSSDCDHCGNSLSHLSHLILSCPFFVRRPVYLGLSPSLSSRFLNPIAVCGMLGLGAAQAKPTYSELAKKIASLIYIFTYQVVFLFNNK